MTPPKQTLGQYIQSVDLAIDEETNGVLSLSNMVDYSEGETALDVMHARGIAPANAAIRILHANGFDF